MAFGLILLSWHDPKDWGSLGRISNATERQVLRYAVAAAQVLGGSGLQFARTVKKGAAVLAVVYLFFALLCVPLIVAKPGVYNSWGNFFEQFCLAAGAALVYANLSPAWRPKIQLPFGRILLGICTASFTLEQAIYLDATASLVPRWLPLTQRFWAVTTTVFFALAAVALLTNRQVLLASRLLTAMLLLFGLLVWLPAVLGDPHNHTSWSEGIETFAIAGATWILVDLVREYQRQCFDRSSGRRYSSE